MSPVLILSWDQPIMVTCAMLSNASELFKTMLSLPELTLHFFRVQPRPSASEPKVAEGTIQCGTKLQVQLHLAWLILALA